MMPAATSISQLSLGANLLANGECSFCVWAPRARRVNVRLRGQDFEMPREPHGIFSVTERAQAGERYSYVLDGGRPLPDPVSRFLPEGVHGPTAIVDPEKFEWSDESWGGIELRDAIFYELHVGTFTTGTFDGV